MLACRLDIPKAPQLLSALHARGISTKAVPMATLQEVCEGIPEVEDRRDYAAAVLQALQACHIWRACSLGCMAPCDGTRSGLPGVVRSAAWGLP